MQLSEANRTNQGTVGLVGFVVRLAALLFPLIQQKPVKSFLCLYRLRVFVLKCLMTRIKIVFSPGSFMNISSLQKHRV